MKVTSSKIFVKTVFSKVCKIFVSECKIIQNLRKNFVFKGNAKSSYCVAKLLIAVSNDTFSFCHSHHPGVKLTLSMLIVIPLSCYGVLLVRHAVPLLIGKHASVPPHHDHFPTQTMNTPFGFPFASPFLFVFTFKAIFGLHRCEKESP